MHWFWHISRQLGSFAGAGRQRGRGRFHTCWWSAGPGGALPRGEGEQSPWARGWESCGQASGPARLGLHEEGALGQPYKQVWGRAGSATRERPQELAKRWLHRSAAGAR